MQTCSDINAEHQPDDVERAMIEFVRRWHSYGGGPACTIFVEFGITERDFFSRTLALLKTDYTAARLSSATIALMQNVCLWRLDAR
ncbi:hypothetical protein GCM10027535_38080 [Mycolicibacterium hippocampi]